MTTVARQPPHVEGGTGSPIRATLDATVPRLCAALRGASSGTLPIPGMHWRVGELGAHIAQTADVFIRGVSGEITAYGERGQFNAEVDQRLVDGLAERDPSRLATLTEDRYRVLREAIADRPDDEVLPHLQDYSIAGINAIWVIDLNLHGYQIGQASGRPFPVDHAALRQALAIVLPFAADPAASRGFRATYAMHFRGVEPIVFTFDDGSARIERDGARVDCHLGVDPITFLLVTLGVIPQWRAIATFKLRAWGRRPWLSGRMTTLLPRVPHGGVGRAA